MAAVGVYTKAIPCVKFYCVKLQNFYRKGIGTRIFLNKIKGRIHVYLNTIKTSRKGEISFRRYFLTKKYLRILVDSTVWGGGGSRKATPCQKRVLSLCSPSAPVTCSSGKLTTKNVRASLNLMKLLAARCRWFPNQRFGETYCLSLVTMGKWRWGSKHY
jgi:hypothetical protein